MPAELRQAYGRFERLNMPHDVEVLEAFGSDGKRVRPESPYGHLTAWRD